MSFLFGFSFFCWAFWRFDAIPFPPILAVSLISNYWILVEPTTKYKSGEIEFIGKEY
jgi:hypothetical protein